MDPGTSVVVVFHDLSARFEGLEVRDTFLVMLPKCKVLCLGLCRVPLSQPTIVEQILKTGTGALNIDVCRVNGRWPTNLLLVHSSFCKSTSCHPTCPVVQLDIQSGELRSGKVSNHHMRNNSQNPSHGGYGGGLGDSQLTGYGDSGGASRFFPQFHSLQECFDWLSKLLN